MTDNTCPIFVGSAAEALANSSFPLFQQYAATSFQFVVKAINDLNAFTGWTPIDTTINFDPGLALQGFAPPPVPVEPDNLDYDTGSFHDPGSVPPTGLGKEITFAPMPTFNGVPAGPIAKNYPGALTATAPAVSFTPTPVTYPNAPPEDAFPDPKHYDVFIPPPVVPNVPVFTATPPVANFAAPRADINFTPATYTSDLQNSVRAQLMNMIANGWGFPPQLEAALFSRERARQDIIAATAIQNAREDVANNGWSMPHGGLLAQQRMARQTATNAAAAASRDIYIDNRKENIESLKFALEKGIALETVTVDLFVKQEGYVLEAAKLTLQVAVEIFNSNVNLFNAKAQLYGVSAAVFRDLIAAENLRLEGYKAQIEAARLIEELNKDEIAILEARIKASTARIERYRAQLSAIDDIIKQDNLRLDGQRLQVQVFDTQVSAWEKQWDVLVKQYEVDVQNGRVFESSVSAFASEVNAIATGNKNLIDQAGLTLRGQELAIQAWRGKLDRLLADMESERNRLLALVQIFDGQARVYQASGEVAKASSDANARAVSIILEKARAQADIAIKNLELKIQQVIQLSAQLLEAKKATATTASQIGGSALAAMHVSATVEEQNSTGMRSDCSFVTTLYGAAS